MIRYVFKNLKNQFTKQRLLSLLVVLNIIVSGLVICFSYGLYQNYNVIVNEGENKEYKEFPIKFDEEYAGPFEDYDTYRDVTDISPSMLVEMMRNLSDETKSNLKDVCCYVYVETQLTFQGNVIGEIYTDDVEPYYADMFFTADAEGDTIRSTRQNFFTNEQINNGEKVVAIRDIIIEGNRGGFGGGDYTYKLVPQDADHVIIGGESYKIVNTVPDWQTQEAGSIAPFYIPPASYPESARIQSNQGSCIYLFFNKPITYAQYEDINNNLFYLGEHAYLPELKLTEATEIYFYKTIMLISVVIAILAAINMAILYRYILEKRTSELAILRLCGCTKGKAAAAYLLECLVINVPLFALTQLAYHKLIMPRLKGLFPNMEGAYSFKLYAAIFGIYVAASTLVMLVMIVFTIRKHSLVTLKSAAKATGKLGIMKIFEVAQLAVVLSIMVMIVSAIVSRYELYLPFEPYLEHKGFLIYPSTDIEQSEFEASIDNSDYFASTWFWFGVGKTTDMYEGIAYNTEYIDAYKPPMESGKWFSETDETYEKDGYVPIVISYCDGKYKVGDVIEQMYTDAIGNPTDTVRTSYKVIGVTAERANIANYPYYSHGNVPSKKSAANDYRDIYSVFDYKFAGKPLIMFRRSDVEASFSSFVKNITGCVFVFCDDLSDEEYEQRANDYSAKFNKVNKFSDVKENSLDYIYEQMYTLFPIALCIFILTVISTVSISAIYTKRQLRNYAIFYICGARWRTCALRSLKNSAITCGIAAAISALVLIVGKLTFLKETVISFGIWHLAVCAGVIVLYLALSMIMPLAIIGSNEPKEVLKEE